MSALAVGEGQPTHRTSLASGLGTLPCRTYQLVTRYSLLKFPVIRTPNFNEFIGS